MFKFAGILFIALLINCSEPAKPCAVVEERNDLIKTHTFYSSAFYIMRTLYPNGTKAKMPRMIDTTLGEHAGTMFDEDNTVTNNLRADDLYWYFHHQGITLPDSITFFHSYDNRKVYVYAWTDTLWDRYGYTFTLDTVLIDSVYEFSSNNDFVWMETFTKVKDFEPNNW